MLNPARSTLLIVPPASASDGLRLECRRSRAGLSRSLPDCKVNGCQKQSFFRTLGVRPRRGRQCWPKVGCRWLGVIVAGAAFLVPRDSYSASVRVGSTRGPLLHWKAARRGWMNRGMRCCRARCTRLASNVVLARRWERSLWPPPTGHISHGSSYPMRHRFPPPIVRLPRSVLRLVARLLTAGREVVLLAP